jgi:hypothetical protein
MNQPDTDSIGACPAGGGAAAGAYSEAVHSAATNSFTRSFSDWCDDGVNKSDRLAPTRSLTGKLLSFSGVV